MLWCNEAFADLVGYGCEDLVGRANAALTHSDDAAAEAAFTSAAPAGGSDTLEHEQRYLHRDGSAIDEWVSARALASARERPVTVNVSASTISDEPRVEGIERTICTSRTTPENLVFEITETAVSEDLDAAHRFAIRMRRLGCGIALDDFGLGHDSFTYLRRLPVDYLKIDTQFVRAFPTSAEDRQIVTAIIGVARQFGLRAIAEGVEDQDTLDGLHRLGVDFVQGYFTGRPMPLGDCWNLIGTPRQGAAHVSSI